MDDYIKQMLDKLGATGDPDEIHEKIHEGEVWDIFRFTTEVAKLAAEHLRDTAIVCAATVIDDEHPEIAGHISMTVGGATPDHRCFGDMVMCIGGKIFNANYGSAAHGLITRESDDA